jgi:hypothetical protein
VHWTLRHLQIAVCSVQCTIWIQQRHVFSIVFNTASFSVQQRDFKNSSIVFDISFTQHRFQYSIVFSAATSLSKQMLTVCERFRIAFTPA